MAIQNTPRWGHPYPQGTDGPDVPAYLQALAVSLDRVAMDDQGTLANRPVSSVVSPGQSGRYYTATDAPLPGGGTGRVTFRDYGTGWEQINPAPSISNDQLAGDIDPAKLTHWTGLLWLGWGGDQATLNANEAHVYMDSGTIIVPRGGIVRSLFSQHGMDTRGGTGTVNPYVDWYVDNVSEGSLFAGGADISGNRRVTLNGTTAMAVAAGQTVRAQFAVNIGNSPVAWSPQGTSLGALFLAA